jgi:hypothetical protein
MYELIPLASGVVAGLQLHRMASSRSRALLALPLALISGVVASVLSGEFAESWALLVWDTTQALVAAFLAAHARAVNAERTRAIERRANARGAERVV